MSKKTSSNCILAREVCQLKALVRAQNKQLSLLVKQVKDDCKKGQPGSEDKESTLRCLNPCIDSLQPDILYHLGIDTGSTNFPNVFGDVRFVCLSGPAQRAEKFASYFMEAIGLKLNAAVQLKDMAVAGHRYAMFKAGPVLCVSHGIGGPSISIVLNELIKMMHHAKCQDPVFIRIGSCGGLGMESGTVVISKEAVNAELTPKYELIIHGKPVQLTAQLDADLAKELLSVADSYKTDYNTILGKTMCANEFYEGQSRLDGAFCEYTIEGKKAYLQKLADNSVTNIEMESVPFAALTHRAGIRAAVVCFTILNRLESDQITASPETMNRWQARPQELIARYIRKSIYGSLDECEEHDEELKKCDCDENPEGC
ncbi:uridine phosphorylase 1 [Drosophila tropicalis]|uniref:uridine phosphorylase 1 n=1 Tax=Drosophila tropicalis TaxID=46794 RepID=UPI0035ABFBF5